MLVAVWDATAVGTWVGAGLLALIAILSAWFGSMRSVQAVREMLLSQTTLIKTEFLRELANLRIEVSKIAETLGNLREWGTGIEAGDTPHIATIKAELVQVETMLDDHGQRIHVLETEHNQQMGRGGCDPHPGHEHREK